MNEHELLERHFDIALETPDGIKKLRELILSLAMRGKLVPQDSNAQPVSELLKEIEVEKINLIKKGKIKKNESLPPIKFEEIKYVLPEGWEWVRLGNIAQHNSGKTLDGGRNVGVRKEYITTSNLYWGNFVLDELRQMPFKDEELEKCTVRKGDLLLCEGGEAGRAAVWDYSEEICFQNHIHRVRFYCEIDSYYAYRFFEKINYTGEINNYRKGVGISNMSGKTLASILFPLPPVKEQKRIVKKIDQLMALCDKLEAERNERDKSKIKIHSTAMNRLLSAPDSTAFNSSWSFITKHFSELYSVTQNVDELKKAILQLAVMGKLVPQDVNDQPAGELLREIEAEKKILVEQKLLKIGILTKDSKNVNQSAKMPDNWQWAKGEDIFFITKLAGFEYTKHFNLKDEGEIPVIRAQNVRPLRLDLENLKYIDSKTSELLDRCALKRKAILVTFIGAGIGDVAIFDKNERWHLAPNVAKMELFENCDEKIDLKYINYFLVSAIGRAEIFKHLKSTAQPSISMGTIRDIDFPVPPINEQKRIVKKIDQLMEICNSLEQQIKDSTEKKSEILEAVLSRV